VKSANYYESNLMEMFPFYLNVDHHLFALAEMDEDGFNCHVGTDFTHLERDIEEEFEEEDDAASQPAPARRLP
jgi:hypothetical protein